MSFTKIVLDANTDEIKPGITRQSIEEQFSANQKQNRDLKDDLVKWVKPIIKWWIYIVLFVVFLSGLKFELCDISFEVPSSVLIALLGTTTASVLGLMYIILKGLFNNEKTTLQT